MDSSVQQEKPQRFDLAVALCYLTFVLIALTLYMVFFYAPTDQAMGIVQRIAYIHISLTAVVLLASFLVMASSAIFLVTNRKKWDIRASAAAEIGALFCTLGCVAGFLWIKPAWNVWWIWNVHFTTLLVVWVMLAGYLLLRKYAAEEWKPRLAGVAAVIAFCLIPTVSCSLGWWQTQHPAPIRMADSILGWEPRMLTALVVSLITCIVLFFYLLQHRVAVEQMGNDLEAIREVLTEEQRAQDVLVENQNFIIEGYTFKEYKKHE